MYNIPQPPQSLIDALKKGKAIAFVGSGLSVAAGSPSWSELLLGIAVYAYEVQPNKLRQIANAILAVHNGQYLDAASLLQTALGNHEFRQSVITQIHKKRTFDLDIDAINKTAKGHNGNALFRNIGLPQSRECWPTISHRILMQLGFRAIITTNYDLLLEQAIAPSMSMPVFNHTDRNLAEHVKKDDPFILKIHGDINNPKEIIITREDYTNFINSDIAPSVLKSLLQYNYPFWIGYGHKDQNIDHLLDELRIKLNLSGGTAIVTQNDDIIKQRLEDAKIFPSVLQTYDAIPDCLKKIAEDAGRDLVFAMTVEIPWSDTNTIDRTAQEIVKELSRRGYKIKYLGSGPGSTKLYFTANSDTYHRLNREISEKELDLAKDLSGIFAIHSVIKTFDLILKHEIKKEEKELSSPSEYNNSEIEFINREDELRAITSTLSAPYLLISAPTGYGKTRLLEQIQSRNENENFCIFIKLSRQTRYTIQALAEEFLKALRIPSIQVSKITNPFVLGGNVGLKILEALVSQNKQKVLLIVDVVEAVNHKETAQLFNEFFPAIVEVFINLESPIPFKIILSGRYISNWKHVSSGYLPFTPLPLTPFDFASVHRTVMKYNDSQAPRKNNEYVRHFASLLMRFTGGHPGCMAKILKSNDFGLPIKGVISQEETYSKNFVLTVIEEIEQEVPYDLIEIFETLSAIRRFNLGLLRHLMNKGFIEWKKDEYELEDRLLETYLVHYDQGFSNDEITRRLFAIQLRRTAMQRFQNVCREAIAFYENQLNHLNIFAPHIISIEILFLNLQVYLWTKSGNSDDFIKILDNILNRLIKFTDARAIIASLKQLLREDWEFKFIFNYLFPNYSFDKLLNRISQPFTKQ